MDYLLSTGDITNANSILVMTAGDLFPAGITLQGFSTDQNYTMDELQFAENRMGVDGNMVAGWIPQIKPVTIMLEPSSPSYDPMVQIYRAMEMRRAPIIITLVATIISIGKIFTWTEGVMKSGTPVPPGKKVLDPTTWKFDFPRLTVTNA